MQSLFSMVGSVGRRALRCALYSGLAFGAPMGHAQDWRANQHLADWRALITEHADAAESKKLEMVNLFVNQARFTTDEDAWGQPEYWATPEEFIAAFAGDCEDFAIAKYYALRAMGVPAERLRIAYGRLREPMRPHMVLLYYATPDATPTVLDSITDQQRELPERRDVRLIYSFNESGLWNLRENGDEVIAGEASRVERWRKVMERNSGLSEGH